MHSVVYVKWNDACEADDMQDAEMENCIQEAAGFFVKRTDNNYYIARDYNTLDEEYLKILRIPEQYIIDFIVMKK
jgi:hypothetical protein